MQIKSFKGLALLLCIVVGSFAIQINDNVFIGGYSSFEYEKQISDDGKGDENGSFDADLIDLVVSIQPHNRIRLAADLTWEHGAATEDGLGNVAIEYAYPELTIFNSLKVRAGKMFTHFGIYNEIHTAKPAFLSVKEPLSTNKNNKFGSDIRFYPRWQTGIGVLGNVILGSTEMDYIIQLSNGEYLGDAGTNPHEEDNDHSKAVSGRLRFTLPIDLSLGLSLYRDNLSEYDEDEEFTNLELERFSIGAQANYMVGNFGAELEFVYGTLDAASGTWSGPESRFAMTALVSYLLFDKLTPYARYEYLDPNSDVDNDAAQQIIYGLNWRIVGNLFLKGEVNSVFKDDNNTYKGKLISEEERSYHEFKAAFVLGF